MARVQHWPIFIITSSFWSLCTNHDLIAVNKDSKDCLPRQDSRTGKCINVHRVMTAKLFCLNWKYVWSVWNFKQSMLVFLSFFFSNRIYNISNTTAMVINTVIDAVDFRLNSFSFCCRNTSRHVDVTKNAEDYKEASHNFLFCFIYRDIIKGCKIL